MKKIILFLFIFVFLWFNSVSFWISYEKAFAYKFVWSFSKKVSNFPCENKKNSFISLNNKISYLYSVYEKKENIDLNKKNLILDILSEISFEIKNQLSLIKCEVQNIDDVKNISWIRSDMLVILNKERKKIWLWNLVLNDKLNNVAQKYAKLMYEKKHFSHTSPDGTSFFKRIYNWWYKWYSVGENIARWQKTVKTVMSSWMNSAGHKANILNKKFKQIWIWYYKWYWVQDFWA